MIQMLARLFTRTEPVLSEAGPQDAGTIANLHAESFRRGWSEEEVETLLSDRGVLAHRAIAGRTLTGFVLSRRVDEDAEILTIAVRTGERSRGLARRLLSLHLSRLAALGAKTVFLEVDENNMPARRLYQRAGFREIGKRPGYYPQGTAAPSAALVLRRDLA